MTVHIGYHLPRKVGSKATAERADTLRDRRNTVDRCDILASTQTLLVRVDLGAESGQFDDCFRAERMYVCLMVEVLNSRIGGSGAPLELTTRVKFYCVITNPCRFACVSAM